MNLEVYLYNLATDKKKGLIPGIIKFFLFILSVAYGVIIRILILFYSLKPRKLACRVISVGNITLGGTGKTCLVELIAVYLKQQGRKAAIISRGYKRGGSQLSAGITQYERMGDEPYMLQSNLKDTPVIVDADRVRGAKTAVGEYSADTVILDDGFQQWRIKKDLEIVTVDAIGVFGNRQMIPRGILREPLSSLKRADVFVLTNVNLSPGVKEIRNYLFSINKKAIILESVHNPVGFYELKAKDKLLSAQILAGKTVTLFSGIGNPDSFENSVKSLGVGVGAALRFPDHYRYLRQDLDNIMNKSKLAGSSAVVTTEKDAVRIPGLAGTSYALPIFVLKVELKIIQDEQRFHNRLLRLYTV